MAEIADQILLYSYRTPWISRSECHLTILDMNGKRDFFAGDMGRMGESTHAGLEYAIVVITSRPSVAGIPPSLDLGSKKRRQFMYVLRLITVISLMKF